MKYLLCVFATACFFKLSTLDNLKNAESQEEEFTLFYDQEAYRKYIEHDRAYSDIEYVARAHPNIPKEFMAEPVIDTASDKTGVVFHRDWFRRYVNKVSHIFPQVAVIEYKYFHGYPYKLLNTVREEQAKVRIDSLFKKKNWFDIPGTEWVTKGIITEIHEYHGDILLRLIPFSYSIDHQPFELLRREEETISLFSNPFYYTGSLSNWSCSLIHPYSCEIQTIQFK